MAGGSWALLEELYESGDPAFVAELRQLHDVERLGTFAARWCADSRPAARQLLADYLALPFNAYRHEALIKRLFKGAEKAGDDEAMGLFLVAFDRLVRRSRLTVTRSVGEAFATHEQANAQIREWEALGYAGGSVYGSGRSFQASAHRQETVIRARRNTMPRPRQRLLIKASTIPNEVRQHMEKSYVLFSVPTRRYLRRRAWRYFRKLGQADAARYRKAAVNYLKRYTDRDVDSDIHLLDNWGLVHTLFGKSPALVHPARGFALASNKVLADLRPAPRFPTAWTEHPQALFELLTESNCRTVRHWAGGMLRRHQWDWLGQQPLSSCLLLIDHADADVMTLGFELLEAHAELNSAPIATWLTRLDGDNFDRLERLSALLEKGLDPARVPLTGLIQLTSHRSLPVARLGLTLLRRLPTLGPDNVSDLLPLAQAECASLRIEIATWLRDFLQQHAQSTGDGMLELLDSKFSETRAIGWTWLQDSPQHNDPAIWQKLLESPYDDIKLSLIANLSKLAESANQDMICWLWASVLLNLHGGGRYKAGVVKQITARLGKHDSETERLLPLLTIAVRSLRGPEFRTGLRAVVTLFETKPGLREAITKLFPELQIGV